MYTNCACRRGVRDGDGSGQASTMCLDVWTLEDFFLHKTFLLMFKEPFYKEKENEEEYKGVFALKYFRGRLAYVDLPVGIVV